MLLKRLAGYLISILRGDGKHDAALAQSEGEPLHGQMRLAARIALRHPDAVQSVIADDTTPDCVVQVKDERLAALASQRCYGARRMLRVERNELIAEREFGHVPQRCVMPLG